MDALRNGRDLALGELTHRIPRHCRDITLQPGVIHALRRQNGLADCAEAALTRAVPDGGPDLRLSERVVQKRFVEAEIFNMGADLSD